MHGIEDKPFDEWNGQKQHIEQKCRTRPVKRRAIWWANLGVNIGHEQDGGGPRFERPVVVLKVFGNGTCLVAPLTNTSDGPFLFDLERHGYRSRVIVTQLRLVSTKRMSRFVERLDERTFVVLLQAIKKANGFL